MIRRLAICSLAVISPVIPSVAASDEIELDFHKPGFDRRLFRTQGTALAQLTRVASEEAALLVRHDLDPDELGQFLRVMLAQVGKLREGLVAGAFEVVRQIPSDAAIVERLVESLAVILSAAGALAPAINRMR